MIDWINVSDEMPVLIERTRHYGESENVIILICGSIIATANYIDGITDDSAVEPMWQNQHGGFGIEFDSVTHWAKMNFPET